MHVLYGLDKVGPISFKEAIAWEGCEDDMIPTTSINKLLASGDGKCSVTRAQAQSTDSLKQMMIPSALIKPANAIGKISPNKLEAKSPVKGQGGEVKE